MDSRYYFDDERTVTAVTEQEYALTRRDSAIKHQTKSGKQVAVEKEWSLQNEFALDFDDFRQLSHMSFAEKDSVCYEASLYEKAEVTKQIVRVVYEDGKPDTCTINKILHREQKKRKNRDERSLLYFSKLESVDVDTPCLITIEERIIGQELLDVINNCKFLPGQRRLGYMANLFIQMCHGVAFLHEHGYTHNDLAPDNILVESGHVRIKIIDFDSAVDVNNPSHPYIVEADGTKLHDWFNMQLFHKEMYRAVECWKAYELVCTNRQRRVFLDLKAADMFSLLILFWQMLTGLAPPVDQLAGANDLAQQFARFGQTGGEAQLAETFEQGFDMYFGDVIDGLNPYPEDIRDNLENLFNIADITTENVEGVGTKVQVNRSSVHDILDLDWLRRSMRI